MDIIEIRKLLHAQPFRPFHVHVADGAKLLVGHPDFIALAPDGSEIIIIYGAKPGEWEVVNMDLVTRLAPAGPERSAKSK